MPDAARLVNPKMQGAVLGKARSYARGGWPVFPCGRDKRPLVKDWPNVATTDPDQIEAWWAKWPGASIGAPTGPGMGSTGAWVLDIDLPDGPENLAALEAKHGPLPATVEQRTGGGGRQLFWRWPEGREIRNTAGERGKLGPGLDVRGAGGYVILPPSGHPSGGVYRWTGNGEPLADAPEWLLDLVAPLPKQDTPKPPTQASPRRAAGSSEYGRKALEDEAAKVASAPEGCRNDVVNKAAFSLAQLVAGGELEREEAESALMAAAAQCGLSEIEALNTIESGFKAGEMEPRKAPEHPKGLTVSDVALDEWEPSRPKPWPVLDPAALPGLAGEFVSLATAKSEADPAAVLATFLVRFACEAGGPDIVSRPHLFIGDSRHEPRLFAVVAGKSSKARKGTSAQPVARLFDIGGGALSLAPTSPGPLSSGEGLVYNVRDEFRAWEVDKKTNSGCWVVKDPGISDKRLCVVDEELAAALRCTKREGNTLSTTLRGLWDSGTVHPLTKTSPTKCTRAHVNIVAHITLEELSRALDDVELFNGFANRFLWVLARRRGLVSRPASMPIKELRALQSRLVDRLYFAHEAGTMEMDSAAASLWDEVYPALAVERGGLLGAVVGRAEAQAQRLAMTYALLDGKAVVSPPHLESALAFWRYCEASAAYIFEGRKTDPLREKILAALQASHKPMLLTELHRATGNSFSGERLKETVDSLITSGLVSHWKEATATKPKNLYGLSEKSELSELSPPASSCSRDNSENSDNSPAPSRDNSENSENSLASSGKEPCLDLWDGPSEVLL